MSPRAVVLKPGREKPLIRRHPWIFSGAVDSFPSFTDGEILPVLSIHGEFLAQAFFHSERSLVGRVLTFEEEPFHDALRRRFQEAYALRKRLFSPDTDSFRLIHAEGDGLPGLIVDLFNDVAVMQFNTLGMWRLKEVLVELLKELVHPRAVYEKSLSTVRALEGLQECREFLWGEASEEITIQENGIRYIVNYQSGQKTGFYLDQRRMRGLIAGMAKNLRVLNCFSYSGGFSLSSLKGGAAHVTSVDSSKEALSLCRRNTELNGFPLEKHTLLQEDLFTFLKSAPLDYDLIILDPPALAKRKGSILNACRAYKELNRSVFQKAPPGSYLLTCSCTGVITPSLFQDLIAQAAAEEKREVRILSCHLDSFDHPHSLFHPEGRYLKSLLLYLS
ncbi:MAG TPA: class I SAM-dependent rRNA methyltransferase [Parachlamydiales bacterium]|nr:MAG: hypothetical protein A2098_00190 [Chlamydiae bacterium GWF2_49_8]OGN58989.1 MAG: hypothetical protein A3D18_02035 [Chlamydiae bacterium RIFCSPHIGHO2_02_FULL_49_29]OGN64192.1 MAG: hypothetical protein A3E26_00340 [Chlamydiae bacterium RIFCSPHIGHO2_12_FULL_49_32]OGN70540.1 MAG: hypothetical protein A3G30_06550 [Chlamydiae bacterium RIFCSPLOWO2_12_FULL_49_12]OGN70727.1 MAG: hypothetical protein A3I15_00555 [Chlamydiae bacterium RIFCSPLOWO2_02_FULL_49_12]HAZ15857.1 class I SAM-dependent rR